MTKKKTPKYRLLRSYGKRLKKDPTRLFEIMEKMQFKTDKTVMQLLDRE